MSASLRDLQIIITRILEEIDRVCRELDIPYVVYGGTAIGAVRHQGFIPWDDDADVLMTRSDYERFLLEAPSIMRQEFRLDNTRTIENFPYMFTKMVLPGTLMIPEFAKQATYQMPIFVDILPVDAIHESRCDFRSMSRRSWFWGRLLFLTGTPRPYLINPSRTKRAAIYAVTSIAYWGLRSCRISPRALQKRWEKAVRRHECDPVTPDQQLADFTTRDPQNWIVTRAELYPALDMPFEDITVKVPRDFDTVLRRGYGDYMKVPPLDQQRNHNPFRIDLGPYAHWVHAARRDSEDSPAKSRMDGRDVR